jgi:phosphoribosylformylglycinamidine synthase
MPGTVRTLIITGVGLNCEKETSKAFELAGAETSLIHLNDLIQTDNPLEKFHILAFIGGFSYGDHLGAGTVFANKLKFKLGDKLKSFVENGGLAIGICNGFQTMTRLGILPALNGFDLEQKVALAHNDSALFRDDWVSLKAESTSPCVFTKGMDAIRLPIRHGEGKFTADKNILEQLENEKLVALRYTTPDGNPANGKFPDNPNGSANDIAGICDPSGRVFGMMPHPEAFLSPMNSPDWTCDDEQSTTAKNGAGLAFFENAVNHIRGAR